MVNLNKARAMRVGLRRTMFRLRETRQAARTLKHVTWDMTDKMHVVSKGTSVEGLKTYLEDLRGVTDRDVSFVEAQLDGMYSRLATLARLSGVRLPKERA